MDVFFSAGGRYVERVLRFRCARVHEEEPRKPAAHCAKDRGSSSGWKPTYRKSGKALYSSKSGQQVYHAEDDYGDDGLEDDPDGEDLEEEIARGETSGRDQSDRDWDHQDA